MLNRGAGRNRILPEQLRPYEGTKTITVELGLQTTDELTKWRQDFIYRGGEPGTGKEAPIGRSGLVPALQTPNATPDITHIPTIMRSKGWNEGATLMEEWFRRPALVRPNDPKTVPNNFGPPILNIIRMDWILNNFARAKSVYDQMMNGKMWKTPNAKGEIGKVLSKTGVDFQLRSNPGHKVLFGDLTSSNVIAIEDVYIQSLPVNEGWLNKRVNYMLDSLDGLTAALAEFNFHMAVKGEATLANQKIQIQLNEIGIYAKDSYDFHEDQSLGKWENGVGSITNSHFRDWRAQNNKGGDFLIYSDIKIVRLNPPDIFVI